MPYDLDQFIADCRAILTRDPGPDGREEVRAYVEEWLNTFGDVHLAIEELVEVNDHVLAVVRGSGWGKASGVEVTNHFCQLWTVSGGVPTRMREFATRDEAVAAAAG